MCVDSAGGRASGDPHAIGGIADACGAELAGAEAQARPSYAGLRYLAAWLALAPAPAFAGAWIAPEGGQEILTNLAGQRAEQSYFESAGYWEAPIARDWSVVAAPWVEQSYEIEAGWRGEATLGVKHAWTGEHGGALALQAGAFWVSEPGPSCGEGGGEARILAGRNFGAHAFVNLEAAGRLLKGGCGAQKLDLTLGYRRDEEWLLMGQVFSDNSGWGESSVKAQLTLVHFGDSGRGLQLGLRARLDGEDAEPALVLGFWGRPGE